MRLALRTAACDTDTAIEALVGMPEIALGGVSPVEEADAEDSDLEEFLCGVPGCDKSFASVRAALAHRARAHGASKNAEYKKGILGASCPVCSRDFEVRLRCIHHGDGSPQTRGPWYNTRVPTTDGQGPPATEGR